MLDIFGPNKKTKKKRRGAVLVEEQPRDVKKLKVAKKLHPTTWTEEEDAVLLDGVEKHGLDWNKIKAESGNRLDKRKAYALGDHLNDRHPDKLRELKGTKMWAEECCLRWTEVGLVNGRQAHSNNFCTFIIVTSSES
ncbi:hypothetical protein TrLO_g8802 [Triparma laevis f. longispina]|uniref:Myb-like domain-containing protein n=1 Tax=Triparma laevis f. longispina TaxID=1714387 RepID=A0A9W7EFV6_9STRA|nr:hypothetical protein TrLO_g8802 [Triparma laevis f. longispina]